MLRRLLALAVAVVLLGAPLAVSVCQIACSAHEAEHQTLHASSHHHSSASAPTGSGALLTTAPRMCSLADLTPVGLEQVRHTLTPPAIVSTAIIAAPAVRFVQARDAALHESPPSFLKLSSQLRI